MSTAPESFSFDDAAADAAAEEITAQAPEISEHAIAQFVEKQSEAEANNGGAEVDADGVPFDPRIHTGSKLKNGKWRTRKEPKSVVAGGSRSRVGKAAEVVVDPEAEKRASTEAQCRAAGMAAAASLVTIGQMFGGEEWAPKKVPINETEMLAQAFGDYFIAKGVTDFPPGVALCMAIGMYAAPRFTMPETRSRMQRMRDWVALRVARRKLRNALRKAGVENAEVTIKDGALYVNGQPAESLSL